MTNCDPSASTSAPLSAEERELGMDTDITRRDFLNAAALGAGAALLTKSAPTMVRACAETRGPSTAPWHPWTGYGGVGDYATSNGNTWPVVNAAHGIRDGLYGAAIPGARELGETYDLVIVGGGFSGTIAAYQFLKSTDRKRSVLLLDNHPVIGGEAKRNEFVVRGHRMIGPQGSNGTYIPTSGWMAELWRDIGMPAEVEFVRLRKGLKAMHFPYSNYDYSVMDFAYPQSKMLENHGHFFETPTPHWVTNPWGRRLEGTPWSPELRQEMLRWIEEPAPTFDGDEDAFKRWLDTMTYEDYLTKVRKLPVEVAHYIDPILAAGEGLGSDALSACLAYHGGFPGLQGALKDTGTDDKVRMAEAERAGQPPLGFSFPGGNDGIMRGIVKWLNPDVIEGSTSFADIHNGRIRFEAMDRPGNACRMRAGATVVSVEHDPENSKQSATITYAKEGRLYTVQARTVVWAAASWSGKHVIQRLPSEYQTAMAGFPRAPMLVVNVALNNWRFLYRLGYTACTWRGGFGFTGNIRAPMHIGDYRPPHDPDLPTLFTFYGPFPQRGLPLEAQGKVARTQLFATSYREFETQIRQQMVKLFGDAGFDARRDIAGIVLNRWGHAYANVGPGFFYGKDGNPAPSAVLRKPLGNLAFAHTELAGIAAWWNAGEEGIR